MEQDKVAQKEVKTLASNDTFLRWQDLGNRLKVAYSAKFGYENKEFNALVDRNITVCENLTLGIGANTKGSSELWLKNMAHLCEITYDVPLSEHRTNWKPWQALACICAAIIIFVLILRIKPATFSNGIHYSWYPTRVITTTP